MTLRIIAQRLGIVRCHIARRDGVYIDILAQPIHWPSVRQAEDTAFHGERGDADAALEREQ